MLGVFVKEYLGTVVVGTVIAALICVLLFHLVRTSRRRGGGCGCGCSSCPMSGKCHAEKDSAENK